MMYMYTIYYKAYFYAPSLKCLPGSSSNWIVQPSICPHQGLTNTEIDFEMTCTTFILAYPYITVINQVMHNKNH